MSYANLKAVLEKADPTDRAEGQLAYSRYNTLLQEIADYYGFGVEQTIAAFAALSPNNDYLGNLRSLVSLLVGINAHCDCNDITVSTYKACRNRAYAYATNRVSFTDTVRGSKIRAFYFNILNPQDRRFVTIDGHMAAAYRANNGTMKENLVKRGEYSRIADTVKRLARREGLIPNQVQATIWFTRKRLLNIKYDAQLDLFDAPDNKWKTLISVSDIKPYAREGSTAS